MFVCLFVCLFCLSVRASVCLSVCLCVCLFVCLSVCLFVCLFVCWFGLVWFGLFVCLFCFVLFCFVCFFVLFCFVCLFVWFGLVWFGLYCFVLSCFVCLFCLVWLGLFSFVCLFVCVFVCLLAHAVCFVAFACMRECMYVGFNLRWWRPPVKPPDLLLHFDCSGTCFFDSAHCPLLRGNLEGVTTCWQSNMAFRGSAGSLALEDSISNVCGLSLCLSQEYRKVQSTDSEEGSSGTYTFLQWEAKKFPYIFDSWGGDKINAPWRKTHCWCCVNQGCKGSSVMIPSNYQCECKRVASQTISERVLFITV